MLQCKHLEIHSTTNSIVVGQLITLTNSVNNVWDLIVQPANSTTGVYLSALVNGTISSNTPQSGNIFSSGLGVSFWFRLPVTGWSSNSVMSSDSLQNIVASSVRSHSQPEAGR